MSASDLGTENVGYEYTRGLKENTQWFKVSSVVMKFTKLMYDMIVKWAELKPSSKSRWFT